MANEEWEGIFSNVAIRNARSTAPFLRQFSHLTYTRKFSTREQRLFNGDLSHFQQEGGSWRRLIVIEHVLSIAWPAAACCNPRHRIVDGWASLAQECAGERGKNGARIEPRCCARQQDHCKMSTIELTKLPVPFVYGQHVNFHCNFINKILLLRTAITSVHLAVCSLVRCGVQGLLQLPQHMQQGQYNHTLTCVSC